MAERHEKTLTENRMEGEEVQERAEQDVKKSAALEERSDTAADAEAAKFEGPLQEESRGEPKQDSIQGKPGLSGTRKYAMALIVSLCLLIGISGGLLLRTQYFSAPESDSAAPRGYAYGLKPFFVPLSASGPKKFLRVTIDLELSGSNSTTQIVTHIEAVRTGIMKILVNIPPNNIDNLRREGLLAEEIISVVNHLVEGNVVNGVIFKDLLVI
jgi:flagellar basal body-associated protein FliL